MDQYSTNNQNEFLWTLLANPANDAHLYTYNLQRLVNDFPQSGILQALLAHASDDKNLKQASVYFNARSLYKLINTPSAFIGVPDEKIIIQGNIRTNGYHRAEQPVLTEQTAAEIEPAPVTDEHGEIAHADNKIDGEVIFYHHPDIDTETGEPIQTEEYKTRTDEDVAPLTDEIVNEEHLAEPLLAEMEETLPAAHQIENITTETPPSLQEPEPEIELINETPVEDHVEPVAEHIHLPEIEPVNEIPVEDHVEPDAEHIHLRETELINEIPVDEHAEPVAEHIHLPETEPVNEMPVDEHVEPVAEQIHLPEIEPVNEIPVDEHAEPVAVEHSQSAEAVAAEAPVEEHYENATAAEHAPVSEQQTEFTHDTVAEDINEEMPAPEPEIADSVAVEETPAAETAPAHEEPAAVVHIPEENTEPAPSVAKDQYEEYRAPRFPAPEKHNDPEPEQQDEDEVYDEITGIEDIKITPDREIDEIDRLIGGSAVGSDYFMFDRAFGEHAEPAPVENVEPEQPAAAMETPVAEQPTAEDTDHQDVSKYHDEKMPYTFMWWLDKTRKEHTGIYQPYVKPEPDTEVVEKIKSSSDPLQQQYYENIFHITSVEELDKSTAPKAFEFGTKRKEQVIIERFIQEEPQIRPQSSDKIDNENKAKKSSEDRDELVTETLAGIYSDQMLYHKAIASYKKLMLKFPEKSRYFAGKIEQLEKKTN